MKREILTRIIVGVVLAILVGGSAPWWVKHLSTEEIEPCPSISGKWHSDGNQITMDIIQVGCDITSSFPHHVLKGTWESDRFTYEVTRDFNCSTVMFGALEDISVKRMVSRIKGTDGNCEGVPDGLPKNFKEELNWEKI